METLDRAYLMHTKQSPSKLAYNNSAQNTRSMSLTKGHHTFYNASLRLPTYSMKESTIQSD